MPVSSSFDPVRIPPLLTPPWTLWLLGPCTAGDLECQACGHRQAHGFDPFMNIVLDECENKLSSTPLGRVVIRGQSIVEIEALETIVAPREVITMG